MNSVHVSNSHMQVSRKGCKMHVHLGVELHAFVLNPDNVLNPV